MVADNIFKFDDDDDEELTDDVDDLSDLRDTLESADEDNDDLSDLRDELLGEESTEMTSEFDDLFELRDAIGEYGEDVEYFDLSHKEKSNVKDNLIRDSLRYMLWSCESLIDAWNIKPKEEASKYIASLGKINGNKGSGFDITNYAKAAAQYKEKNPNATLLSYTKLMILTVLNSLSSKIKKIDKNSPQLQFYLAEANALGIIYKNARTFDECKQKVEYMEALNQSVKEHILDLLNKFYKVWMNQQSLIKVSTKSERECDEYIKALEDKVLLLIEAVGTAYSQKMINNNVDNADKEYLGDRYNRDLSQEYAIAKSITISNNMYTLTCECGNAVKSSDIITFNLINREKNDRLPSATLNDLYNQDNGNTWLAELKDPSNIFTENSKTNTDMLDELYSYSLSDKDLNIDIVKFIKMAYGCACTFGIDCECSSCHKRVILPPILLRYLSCWHTTNHDNDIYRSYTDNIVAPGKIRYTDSVLQEVFRTYVSNMTEHDDSMIRNYESNISGTADAMRYRASLESGFEVINDEDKPSVLSTVQESFMRIKNRQLAHNLNLEKYKEHSNIRRMLLNENSGSKKQVSKATIRVSDMGLNYWRDYNTSEDKMLSALMYMTKALHLPFDVSPKAVLSEIVNHTKRSSLRNAIRIKASYSNMTNGLSVINKYMELTPDGFSGTFQNIDSKYNTWKVEEVDVEEIIEFVLDNIKDYNDALPDENKLDINFDEVSNYTIKDVKAISDIISGIAMQYRSSYDYWRNSDIYDYIPISTTHGVDNTIIQYITDELPWRVWYKLGLVAILSEYNPSVIMSMAPKATKGQKLTKGIAKLTSIIKKSAKDRDPMLGSDFWYKVPKGIRDPSIPVLNKNMKEISLINIPAPLPITKSLIAYMLQSDNVEDSQLKISNYMKTEWIDDVRDTADTEYFEHLNLRNIEEIEMWVDTVQWIQNFTPSNLKDALPRYLRDYVIEETL